MNIFSFIHKMMGDYLFVCVWGGGGGGAGVINEQYKKNIPL